MGMMRASRGCRSDQKQEPHDQRSHGRYLASADRLVQQAVGTQQHHDKGERERGLHNRHGCQTKSGRVQQPAAQRQHRAHQPAP